MIKGQDGCDQAENTSSCWDKGVAWGRAAHRGDKNWTEAADDMKRDSCWGTRIDGKEKNLQCWMRGSKWGRGAEAECANHPTEEIAKAQNPRLHALFGGGRRKKSKRKSKSHKRKSHKRKSHKRKSHKHKSRRIRRR